VKYPTSCKAKYTKADIGNVINVLIVNVLKKIGGKIFLHSYEAEFVQELLRKKEKKLAQLCKYYR